MQTDSQKKARKPRVKKADTISEQVVANETAAVPNETAAVPNETAAVEEKKTKIRKTKKKESVVKIIEDLKDKTIQDSATEEEKNEVVLGQHEDTKSHIVTDLKGDGEDGEAVYGYLIIQEFPHINTTYVIGSKPFGQIWFNYTEALERFIAVLIDWQIDFDNKEFIHSKKPRIVKIRMF